MPESRLSRQSKIRVKVSFYGVIKDAVSEPTIEVQMPNKFTLRQLLNNLGDKCGESFRESVLDDQYGVKNYVRLFVNKELIDNLDLDRELGIAERSVDASILIMPSFEGG